MSEKKVDIGKLAFTLTEGHDNPTTNMAMFDAAHILHELADLLDKHGIEGVKELCEAVEKLARGPDGTLLWPGRPIWIVRDECEATRVEPDQVATTAPELFDLYGPERMYGTKEAALQALKETQKGDG